MRTLLHLSDIHFGKIDRSIINAIFASVLELRPDLLVISGDITQRARKKEFEDAAAFIEAIRACGVTVFAVPGNHDILPLYSPIKRTRAPFKRYNEIIRPVTIDSFADSELALYGMNTVRASRLKDGHVSLKNIADATGWFEKQKKDLVRILVSHHPLDLPDHIPNRKLARKAERGIYGLSKVEIDIYLSGHYHRSSMVSTNLRYSKKHHAAIAVQAGTVSTRSRGELQSFNILHVERDKISVAPHRWNTGEKKFLKERAVIFELSADGWFHQ